MTVRPIRKPVTLKEVAALSGFDPSTISRVLRDDRTLSIRPESVAAIKEAARELGYEPNLAGRRLGSARSYTIATVIGSLENPIHAQIIDGIQTACLEQGYTLLISSASSTDKQVDQLEHLISKNRVDGLLALTFQDEKETTLQPGILEIPTVAVNWRAEGTKNFVTFAESAGGELATQHLIDLGHRRIAHLSGDLTRFNARERHDGYRAALEKAGIPYDAALVETAGYTFDEGVEATERLLDRIGNRFTAIFAVTLMAGAGALYVLRKHGVKVPEQVSVVGVHDALLANVLKLTVVSFPLIDMGRFAASGLIRILSGDSPGLQYVFEGGQLVHRESTARAPRDLG